MGKNEGEIYLYKRERSSYYYFRYVTSTGKVIRESTKKSDENEALQVAKKRIASLDPDKESLTLRDIIVLSTDPETNQRYKQAKVDGTLYEYRTAEHVASTFRSLLKILEKDAASILKKEITDITKRDIIIIKDCIISEYGTRPQGNICFKKLRALFSHYVSQGILEYNPATGIRAPKSEEKEKVVIPAPCIAKMIDSKDMFPESIIWSFFTFCASTGMRYGEAIVINKSQLKGNILTINKALKDNDKTIGLPKFDNIRIITLSKLAMKAIENLETDDKGFYFLKHRITITKYRSITKNLGGILFPEEKDLFDQVKGWHNLRHSLNTNLLLEPDLNPALIAEYMAWEHQIQSSAMQQHYTHIYAKNLQIIADRIDKIYGKVKENQLKATQSS